MIAQWFLIVYISMTYNLIFTIFPLFLGGILQLQPVGALSFDEQISASSASFHAPAPDETGE